MSLAGRKSAGIEDGMSAATIFKLLGVDAVRTLDAEDADIFHDPALPIPRHFKGCADFIVDGGALSDLFTPEAAIRNYATMLRAGRPPPCHQQSERPFRSPTRYPARSGISTTLSSTNSRTARCTSSCIRSVGRPTRSASISIACWTQHERCERFCHPTRWLRFCLRKKVTARRTSSYRPTLTAGR